MKLQIVAEATTASIEAEKRNLKDDIEAKKVLLQQTIKRVEQISGMLINMQNQEAARLGVNLNTAKYWQDVIEPAKKANGIMVYIPGRYVKFGYYCFADKNRLALAKQSRIEVLKLNNVIAQCKTELRQSKGQLKGISVPHRRQAPVEKGAAKEDVQAKFEATKQKLITALKACNYYQQLLDSYNESVLTKLWRSQNINYIWNVPAGAKTSFTLNKYDYGQLRSAWKHVMPNDKNKRLRVGRETGALIDPNNPNRGPKFLRILSQRIAQVVALHKEWDYLDRYARAHKIAVTSDK